jgi:RimJ/RimL family protein N-acetyltransferase
MLQGEVVTLRPVRPEDLPALYEWRIDAETWELSEDAPLVPLTLAVYEERYRRRAEDDVNAEFAIDADGELVGRCGMFEFDHLARHATIGITIGMPHRGRGYGRDAVRVLLDYGFRVRNLHRVRLDTVSTNEAGRRAYLAAGFVEEGRQREHAWVDNRYVDLVLMGILRSEWDTGR